MHLMAIIGIVVASLFVLVAVAGGHRTPARLFSIHENPFHVVLSGRVPLEATDSFSFCSP